MMVGESSSGGLIRALQEQKREEVALLLEMMMTGGLRPVKATDWAEKTNIDEYYLGNYARDVCNLFPPGIVKMKDDNFVMGDALTKYVNHAKTIYAHEMMVILDEKEKMSEKEITSNLGVASLEALLSMKTIQDIFYVENMNGELFVSMRT
ncbi:hypothetical protein PRIPAC_75818 [Pristionchus pacificus]|uniref:Uncharacterized protein n=1 Tax=Pristionchus pacificus TaxID=54126 RepID=A0A454XYU3_PRIPA|nr:hypothetical protein PRIPAC_75818 [Pristionchus pacificus]|eukprot:PDM83528.1 hypothetical protein PRIPAC_30015 [Pristionchus pacificus]